MVLAAKLMADAKRRFPWYDSVWLRRYVAAKKFIEILAPDRLEAFTLAFEPLRTSFQFSIKTLPRLFDDLALGEVRRLIADIGRESLEHHEQSRFGRDILHNHPLFTRLQGKVLPLVSELAGEPLESSYNFLSIYRGDGVCEPHLDAPDAKWTLDVCLDQDEPWPIYFSQVVPWPEDRASSEETDWQDAIKRLPDVRFEAVSLMPNQAVLFSGSSQWHYRNPRGSAARGSTTLVFFHFIPVGTSDLLRPYNWPELFNVPELVALVGPPPADHSAG